MQAQPRAAGEAREVVRFLNIYTSKKKVSDIFTWVIYFLYPVLALAIIGMVAYKLLGLSLLIREGVIWAVAALTVAGICRGVLTSPKRIMVAKLIDDQFGLKDRLTSAVCFIAQRRESALVKLAISDAAGHIREKINRSKVRLWQPPRQMRVTIGLAVIFLLITCLVPGWREGMGAGILPKWWSATRPSGVVPAAKMAADTGRYVDLAAAKEEEQKGEAKKKDTGLDQILDALAQQGAQAISLDNLLQKPGEGKGPAQMKGLEKGSRDFDEKALKDMKKISAEEAKALGKETEIKRVEYDGPKGSAPGTGTADIRVEGKKFQIKKERVEVSVQERKGEFKPVSEDVKKDEGQQGAPAEAVLAQAPAFRPVGREIYTDENIPLGMRKFLQKYFDLIGAEQAGQKKEGTEK